MSDAERLTPQSGGFIVTATGKPFYFECPEGFAFEVEDIAPALGNLCRFAGQAGWWSVAQHSMFVAELVAPEHQLRALLHDASEAFLVDVPEPLKNLPAMAGYRALEARVENAIFKTFGAATDPDAVKTVKQADLIALRAERPYYNRGRVPGVSPDRASEHVEFRRVGEAT